ncbi:MAG: hypothetical protein LBC18_15365 [Opitutaceae bacterium]|jgi:hypothetical protein|nr:hypothetical protein [Opitutaceae bacterium]
MPKARQRRQGGLAEAALPPLAMHVFITRERPLVSAMCLHAKRGERAAAVVQRPQVRPGPGADSIMKKVIVTAKLASRNESPASERAVTQGIGSKRIRWRIKKFAFKH